MKLEGFKGKDGKFTAFVWPGGYPVVYLTKDGSTVCPTCANRPVDQSQEVTAADVNWEGPPTACDDCGKPMESAYGDPDKA